MNSVLLRALGAGLFASVLAAAHASAADLEWEVDNPFRFYRNASAFALHENAYQAVRGEGEVPADIVSRVEKRMNAPDCRDPSTAANCAATVRNERTFQSSRLGWAAKTINAACYDRESRPRRYPSSCARIYGQRAVKEDYILPDAHVVRIGLSAEKIAAAGEGASCAWSWRARRGGDAQTKTQACKDKLTLDRVPYIRNSDTSGVDVEVTLPDGAKLTEQVVVEDLLVVALGDSFASGESNPDKPVTFGSREMSYEPQREDYQRTDPVFRTGPGTRIPDVARPGTYNPRVLPRRLMEDEERGEQLARNSPEFLAAFNRRNATWLSPDCHRSQYGYPFRVAMQLALEDRHRSVTLVHLACSGAQVTEGLFVPKEAREDFSKPNSAMVPAQFDQLTELLCRDGSRRSASYTMPFFKYGQDPQMRTIAKQWCASDKRKRPIDVVLLSIGGNDVGFSPLAAYAMTESASDLAPIAGWMGSDIRFGPDVARKYTAVLDRRMAAVKDALRDGFGVAPDRVIQTAYEPIQYDENGALCGARPTLGMDVHPALKLGGARLAEAGQFFDFFVKRMQCMANGRGGDCGGLATGAGTGFRLVTEHHAKFRRRGLCARLPAAAEADGAAMAMPRFNPLKGEFQPYHPALYTPYGPRHHLFRTPNDAYLTANTHHERIPLFDILQPVYAALYSGAIHPTAEGHAIVADAVMPYARRMFDKPGKVEVPIPTTAPPDEPPSAPAPSMAVPPAEEPAKAAQ
ncbi:hypothetical protein GJW-30_1_03841 [Variibacter gotjawalensis]|uniref:SGNH hydrolase-type esterase domain-containing protein n=1 Tax=Variibacter gotjawalensis TaxID=1333996 RepID=A0A0S3PZD8_9BRAD|nr:hypothetical protein [Variibacter gotjawalensis]NIK47122.1 hypothetical protein [Variibacter gotjawalensis]RZS49024.1 hypothetical protein EV661_1448 [Variibacter gotjawalensis]BAT61284.1 hypothetical protein GJW-30_1_03841 [Variibacter gotjawalensis]